MTYTPMVGDIGCVPMAAPGGPLILAGQQILRRIYHDRLPAKACDYQHAFTYGGQGFVFEARPGGAGFRELAEYDADNILWLPQPLSVQQRQTAQELMNAKIGTPYSVVDYGAIAVHALGWQWCADWAESYVKDDGHMICSQMCDWIQNQLGNHLFLDGRWEGFVTPMDLAATGM